LARTQVVAMPNATPGERACLYVGLLAGATLALDELTAYLLQQGVAKYKLPERGEVLHELPGTSSGNVQKGPLREDIMRGVAESEPKAD
jgi:non-ribosomal peptide synthetase component E (peptide arylation enzyme)